MIFPLVEGHSDNEKLAFLLMVGEYSLPKNDRMFVKKQDDDWLRVLSSLVETIGELR